MIQANPTAPFNFGDMFVRGLMHGLQQRQQDRAFGLEQQRVDLAKAAEARAQGEADKLNEDVSVTRPNGEPMTFQRRDGGVLGPLLGAMYADDLADRQRTDYDHDQNPATAPIRVDNRTLIDHLFQRERMMRDNPDVTVAADGGLASPGTEGAFVVPWNVYSGRRSLDQADKSLADHLLLGMRGIEAQREASANSYRVGMAQVGAQREATAAAQNSPATLLQNLYTAGQLVQSGYDPQAVASASGFSMEALRNTGGPYQTAVPPLTSGASPRFDPTGFRPDDGGRWTFPRLKLFGMELPVPNPTWENPAQHGAQVVYADLAEEYNRLRGGNAEAGARGYAAQQAWGRANQASNRMLLQQTETFLSNPDLRPAERQNAMLIRSGLYAILGETAPPMERP